MHKIMSLYTPYGLQLEPDRVMRGISSLNFCLHKLAYQPGQAVEEISTCFTWKDSVTLPVLVF